MTAYFFGLTTLYIFGQKFLQFFIAFFGKLQTPKIHSEINSPLGFSRSTKVREPSQVRVSGYTLRCCSMRGHFTQQVTKMLSILGITTSSSVKSEERNAKIVVLLLSLSGVDIGSTAASCYSSVATFQLLQHYACTMLLIHTCLQVRSMQQSNFTC